MILKIKRKSIIVIDIYLGFGIFSKAVKNKLSFEILGRDFIFNINATTQKSPDPK